MVYMKTGIKKRGFLGVKRIALEGKIEKIEMKQNHGDGKGGLMLFFRGLEGLGFVNFSQQEIERIAKDYFGREIKGVDNSKKKRR